MRIQAILIAAALAGCGIEDETDQLETGEVEAASSVYQWAWQGYVPNQKSYWQVGTASYKGRLQLVHNGMGTPSQLWSSSFDGTTWTANKLLSLTSTGGPSLVVHGDKLKMIYRAAGQNRLMMSTFDDSRRPEDPAYIMPVTIGSYLGTETLTSEPAAATYGGKLYVAYCTQHKLRIDRFDGVGWSLAFSQAYAPNGWCEHVELAVLPDDGALHVVYSTMADLAYGDPSYAMRDYRTFDGISFASTGQTLTMKTKQPISITSCNGITHMTHGGFSTSSEIWWAERRYGAWSTDFRVPSMYSTGGAALACFGTKTLMIFPDISGWLNRMEFGP